MPGKVHDRINANNLKYEELSDDIKKLIAVYYGHSIDQANNVDNAMEYVLRFSDFINGNVNISISYEELTKSIRCIVGTLTQERY